jgi:hypothetical protein
MRKITSEIGNDQATDAFSATNQPESSPFMSELLALYNKHGMALVPQSCEYDVDFHCPMRVVPLTPDIERELKESWVCFER